MINNGYPCIEEAVKLWEAGIEYRKSKSYGFDIEDEYRFHTQGVASAAYKIAERTLYINPEKAYILGLLHDYGKRISESDENYFHGREGYEQMNKLGYYDVAKICLTHSFFDKNFNYNDMTYPLEWMKWAKRKLKTIEYDDYDRLICLCDKFFEGLSVVTIEERVKGIVKRYKINKRQEEIFKEKSLKIKKYFDKMIDDDIYKILHIGNQINK